MIWFHTHTHNDNAGGFWCPFQNLLNETGHPHTFKDNARTQLWPDPHHRHPVLRVIPFRRGFLFPFFVRRGFGRIKNDIGPHHLSKLTSRRRKVSSNNRANTGNLEPGNNRKPHRSTANNQGHIIVSQTGLLHRMPAHRHRLCHGGLVRRQAIGHFQQHGFVQHHLFCKTTRVGVGIANALHTAF